MTSPPLTSTVACPDCSCVFICSKYSSLAAGVVQDVALGRELGRPDDVAPDHVYRGLPGLQLRLYLLEVLVARGRGGPPRHVDLALVLLVEPVDKRLQTAGSIRAEGKGDAHRPPAILLASATTGQRSAPEQHSPGEPSAPELEEPPAV